MRQGCVVLLLLLSLLGSLACSDGATTVDGDSDGDSEGAIDGDVDADATDGDSEYEGDNELNTDVPADIPPLVDALPFNIERDDGSLGPDAAAIADFTRAYGTFFKDNQYFPWLARYSQGLPNDNDSGMPGYKVWWTNAFATKRAGVVTISWDHPSDNSTAKVGRALPPLIGLGLFSADATIHDLALGYMRGLSANFDGMIWADEDPLVEGLMARCIFQKPFQAELDGGRVIAVDYDSVRYEVIERRHDTVHNPNNPSYGDIYVRNKRSKDDFPYLYRDMFWLVRLIHKTDDGAERAAAITLFRQVRAMAADIVAYDYSVRTKDGNGEPFIPTQENGLIDDFASFCTYDALFPLAECNAKLATAYLAAGEKLDNECLDENSDFYGDGGGYEDVAIATQFWASNMIWGYHVTALAMAQTFGDMDTAHKLLDGLALRLAGLMDDPQAENESQWMPDLAQLLVQAAAYGMPLTGREAALIQQQYADTLDFYTQTVVWDPWAVDVPDDTAFATLPDRNEYNDADEVIKTHVRPTEILNPFEYCASPLRATGGAQFIDCDILLDPARWGE